MERRTLFTHATAGALGLALSQTFLSSAGAADQSSFLEAASSCQKEALACQAHCVRLLEKKDTSIMPCFKRIADLLAINEAMMVLATRESPLAKMQAAVLKKASDDCAVECAKHAKHHKECAACEKACIALSKSIGETFA